MSARADFSLVLNKIALFWQWTPACTRLFTVVGLIGYILSYFSFSAKFALCLGESTEQYGLFPLQYPSTPSFIQSLWVFLYLVRSVEKARGTVVAFMYSVFSYLLVLGGYVVGRKLLSLQRTRPDFCAYNFDHICFTCTHGMDAVACVLFFAHQALTRQPKRQIFGVPRHVPFIAVLPAMWIFSSIIYMYPATFPVIVLIVGGISYLVAKHTPMPLFNRIDRGIACCFVFPSFIPTNKADLNAPLEYSDEPATAKPNLLFETQQPSCPSSDTSGERDQLTTTSSSSSSIDEDCAVPSSKLPSMCKRIFVGPCADAPTTRELSANKYVVHIDIAALESKTTEMVRLGFHPAAARQALVLCGLDINRALEVLQGPDEV